jgi:putative sterol carrier protein
MSAKEFFESLPTRIEPSRIAGMTNSYVFDVDGAGKWTVDVKDGAVSVSEGADEADVTLSMTEENFEKMVARELNPTTAYMSGKLKVKGDMGAAMKLQKLF